MKKIDIEIIKYSRKYNIIKIYRNKLIDYYLEKKGYADLFHMFGVYDNFEIIPEMVPNYIIIAENENFWY